MALPFMLGAIYQQDNCSDKLALKRYWNDAKSGKIQVLRRGGGLGTPALICYENMPDSYKEKIQKLVPNGDVMKEAQRNEVQILIQHNEAISDFYSDFEVDNGVKLQPKKALEYYNNAIVMIAVGKLYSEKKAYKKKMQVRKFWKMAAQQVMELLLADKDTKVVKYPHNLPLNPDRLQDKYNDFFDATRYTSGFSYNLEAVMKLGRFGIKSAEKVGEEQQGILFELLKNNIDDVAVCRLYNYKAKNESWDTITASTVGNWRVKWQTELHAARYGINSFFNSVAAQHKRKRPDFPLYYWTMDGWDAELYYKKDVVNKQGRTVTTFHHRANVVFVLDASINYIIGYAIGERETGDLIKEAMKNAVNHTKQIFGQKYCPVQLQSDRFGVAKIGDLSKKGFTKYYTPAKAYNAKSKVVEPFNKDFNKEYLPYIGALYGNWSGYGVKANDKKQPNSELINMNKIAFPTYSELVKQIEFCIMIDRGRKFEHFMSLWNIMPSEKRLPMSDEKYLMMFGRSSTERALKGGRDGRILMQPDALTLTLDGQKYDYDCYDVEFRRHLSTRWEIIFDTEDMSKAVAVNEDGTRRFMLEEKYIQPMALIERKEGDAEQLARVNNYNEELKAHIRNFHDKMGASAAQAGGAPNLIEALFINKGESLPKIKSELDKVLITNSAGEHKAQRYLDRAEATEENEKLLC